MNTEEKLKNICNFEHKSFTLPHMQYTYMEFETQDSLRRKQLRRDQKIGELLGEVDEYDSQIYLEELDENENFKTISPKIMSTNIQGKNFQSLDQVMDDILDYIVNKLVTDTNSQHPMLTNVKLSKSENLSIYENNETMIRRIITRIFMACNIISSEGRIGPGNTILISDKTAYELISMDINNHLIGTKINIVTDQRVPDGRVIVCRGGDDIQKGGLMAVVGDTHWFTNASENYLNQYTWFELEIEK